MVASAHSLILKPSWDSLAQFFSEKNRKLIYKNCCFQILSLLLEKQTKLTKEKFQGSPPSFFLENTDTGKYIKNMDHYQK